MNHELKHDDRRRFEEEMWKVDKTSDVLTELERKMYSHFGRKNNEDALLNSQDEQF
jgi:hypothetical protein